MWAETRNRRRFVDVVWAETRNRRRFVDVVWAEMRNRRRAVEARRGWSREAGTLRVKTPTPNTHFSILNKEDFSILYRARGSGEGPC